MRKGEREEGSGGGGMRKEGRGERREGGREEDRSKRDRRKVAH